MIYMCIIGKFSARDFIMYSIFLQLTVHNGAPAHSAQFVFKSQ
jgi:hypothetical protein